jgi:hypothetical protein
MMVMQIKSTLIYTETAYVVWWLEFLATDQEATGSILGATRFSEK